MSAYEELLGPDNTPNHSAMDILSIMVNFHWDEFVEEFTRGYDWSSKTVFAYVFLLLNTTVVFRYIIRAVFWVYDHCMDLNERKLVLAPFDTQEYWNTEYSRDRGPFEWNADYFEIQPIVSRHIKRDASVLYIGCGTSLLGSNLYDDGFKNIMCCDFSRRVIKRQLDSTAPGRPGLEFRVMDALNLHLPNECKDMVVDKGCLDSVSCNLREGETLVRQLYRETLRVLRPGGVFLLVTTLKRTEALSLAGPLLRHPYSASSDSGTGVKVGDVRGVSNGCITESNSLDRVGDPSFEEVETVVLTARSELRIPQGEPIYAIVLRKVGSSLESQHVSVNIDEGGIPAEGKCGSSCSESDLSEIESDLTESDSDASSEEGEEDDNKDESDDYLDSTDVSSCEKGEGGVSGKGEAGRHGGKYDEGSITSDGSDSEYDEGSITSDGSDSEYDEGSITSDGSDSEYDEGSITSDGSDSGDSYSNEDSFEDRGDHL